MGVCLHKFSIYIRAVGKDPLGFKRRKKRDQKTQMTYAGEKRDGGQASSTCTVFSLSSGCLGHFCYEERILGKQKRVCANIQ